MKHLTSPSSRRAWIEIGGRIRSARRRTSPSSRRAWIEIDPSPATMVASLVALLAEGVDRNRYSERYQAGQDVALLAEGVDRNSAYRSQWSWHPGVALLAEGVDRNYRRPVRENDRDRSPSSRRAWIEIASAT